VTRSTRPADFVSAHATEARIDRQWAAIERAGLPGPPIARGLWRRARVPLFAGALCAALASAIASLIGPLALRQPAQRSLGALVESVQTPIAMRLEDGSQLELAPRTGLQLLHNEPRAIELSLRSGRARFHVTHSRARSFKIDVGQAEVRVVGTRFEIERSARGSASLVRVSVYEGVVEIRRRDQAADGGELRRLRAGETWSALFEPPGAAMAVPVTPSKAEAASEQGGRESRTVLPASEDERGTPAAAPASLESQPEAKGESPPTRAAAPAAGSAGGKPSASAAAGAQSAAGLFRLASLARRGGRLREAADDYSALLASHPMDARAGLSAFELGRIRMDALGEPLAAIEALERAVAAGARTSFHEDALARIVVANDALGRREACRRARERYLAGYPHGVHARALLAQCR
jgi:hypothetical protein